MQSTASYNEQLYSHIVNVIIDFEKYIKSEDHLPEDAEISFSDINSIFYRSEGYKPLAYEAARAALSVNEWKSNMIGSGEIAEYATKAVKQSKNLVDRYQKFKFFNKVDNAETLSQAEQVLYDIYCTNDMKSAFENAVNFFGGTYDIIAFLFFLRDKDKYLPIHSSHFDQSFAFLRIDFKTSRRCSWENYKQFIEEIRKIRDIMRDELHCVEAPSLLDAHSLTWMMHLDDFQTWYNKNQEHSNEQQNNSDEIKKIGCFKTLNGYDKKALVKCRVNQGAFRTRILNKYGEKCCLCGIELKELLIASHIKPWADSNRREKLSENNGLLLCANHDKLFDKGYISFDDNGHILISDKLDVKSRKPLNISGEAHLNLSKETLQDMLPYLNFHRATVFKW